MNDRNAMIIAYLEDPDFQNSLNPMAARMGITTGIDCDALPGAIGDFGRCLETPIPVNGALGQVTYLSKLRTSADSRLLFHRLGSKSGPYGFVDLFEVLSFDGQIHETLYLDFYHPRRSSLAPSGYYLSDEISFITGDHIGYPDFPNGYREITFENAVGRGVDFAYEDPDFIEQVVAKIKR